MTIDSAKGLACPGCGGTSTTVIRSGKYNDPPGRFRRRRACTRCGVRFGTLEVVVPSRSREERLLARLREVDEWIEALLI